MSFKSLTMRLAPPETYAKRTKREVYKILKIVNLGFFVSVPNSQFGFGYFLRRHDGWYFIAAKAEGTYVTNRDVFGESCEEYQPIEHWPNERVLGNIIEHGEMLTINRDITVDRSKIYIVDRHFKISEKVADGWLVFLNEPRGGWRAKAEKTDHGWLVRAINADGTIMTNLDRYGPDEVDEQRASLPWFVQEVGMPTYFDDETVTFSMPTSELYDEIHG